MSPSKVNALRPPNEYSVARQLGSHLFFNEIIGLTSSSMSLMSARVAGAKLQDSAIRSKKITRQLRAFSN